MRFTNRFWELLRRVKHFFSSCRTRNMFSTSRHTSQDQVIEHIIEKYLKGARLLVQRLDSIYRLQICCVSKLYNMLSTKGYQVLLETCKINLASLLVMNSAEQGSSAIRIISNTGDSLLNNDCVQRKGHKEFWAPKTIKEIIQSSTVNACRHFCKTFRAFRAVWKDGDNRYGQKDCK